MDPEHGIYTITSNMYYDTRLGPDKRCSVISDMPAPKGTTEECEEREESCLRCPTSKNGKIALAGNCLILLIVLLLILLIEFGFIPHHYTGFYCQDPKYSFEFQGDTISIATLMVTIYVFPIVVIAFIEVKLCKGCFSEGFRRTWYWYKEYFVGATFAIVLIELGKVITGEPRPHFFHTCRPNTAFNCSAGYISHYECTNKQDRAWFVSDAAKSFPSGHAALSVYLAAFLSWYVQCCMPKVPCSLLKIFVQTAFVSSSILCSLSRITDHRHHWWDVLAGAVLGAACAVYTIIVLCHRFKRSPLLPPRASQSTCTLLTDTTNKHATSVIL